MSFRQILALVVVASVVIALFATRGLFSGSAGVAHRAVRLHLELFASSIYEYHRAKGKWPTRIDDFEETTLPARSPHWRSCLASDAMVILWHKDLMDDPKQNRRQILAYHDKGLIAARGRQWVCWGDLRTEYIPSEELRAYLERRRMN